VACAAIGRLDAVLHGGATPLVRVSAEDLLVAADSACHAPLAAARTAALAHYDHALEAWVNTNTIRLFAPFLGLCFVPTFPTYSCLLPFNSSATSRPSS
jgi:hypothetical protein